MRLSRKILMSAIATLLFFIVLEGALALFGVEPRLYHEDPYVGFSSHSPLFVKQRSDGGEAAYGTANNKLSLFNAQTFPARKPRGARRVFCMGGSTTFGRPYDDATSFCGWLRELLPDVDPTVEWEVINAGGVSYASYRVALLMEELVDYDPDLFVIYSGQNEFLEERTYRDIITMTSAVRGLGALAARTRTHAVITGAIRGAEAKEGDQPVQSVMGEEVDTLLDSAVGPSAFSRDDEHQQRVVEHFAFNLARMVDIAHSARAAVILAVPASNLRSCTPFKAEHRKGVEAAEVVRWQNEIRVAKVALQVGGTAAGLKNLEAAEQIDGRHAELLYLKGQVLERLGRVREARVAYERARDEDICPLRMLGRMGDVIREVADDRGVPLVDFEAAVVRESDAGIPGQDLFLDHVHPTIEGNLLLAREFLEAMIESDMVEPVAGWGEGAVDEVRESVLASVDEEAHALALMKLSKVLGWAGKLEESDRLSQQAAEKLPGDSRVQYQAGLSAQLQGRNADAERHYRLAVEAQPDADLPHQNLGVLLEEKGDLVGSVEHYRLALRHARTRETQIVNTVNLAQALLGLGYEHYQGRRFAEAESCFAEADQLSPGDAGTLARLGLAQMALGKGSEAAASLERAVSVEPLNPRLRNQLSAAYAAAGRDREAVVEWVEAVHLQPDLRGAPDATPRILRQAGKSDLAALMEKAVGGG